jgi:hypothetical protein
MVRFHRFLYVFIADVIFSYFCHRSVGPQVNFTATSSVVSGFIWSTEMKTTSTTTAAAINGSDAFYKLLGLDGLLGV